MDKTEKLIMSACVSAFIAVVVGTIWAINQGIDLRKQYIVECEFRGGKAVWNGKMMECFK